MRDFTHVSNFPDYMTTVTDYIIKHGRKGQTVFDLPAGNGKFGDGLHAQGFAVTWGDINAERPNYVHVNMEAKLPFDDNTFDFVTCMEGIEHVINPNDLVREMSRIVKPGGHVIITMPNVQNFYSRLSFLFSGVFYQFNPDFSRHPGGRELDRGHISSLSYIQLVYLFGEYKMNPVWIDGDRFKKKILFPVYLVLGLINFLFFQYKILKKRNEMPYQLMTNIKFFLSRSLIAGWRKEG